MRVFYCLLIACLVSVALAEEYVLQQGDVILLTVFQEEDLTRQVKIDRSGHASFNLVGNQKISGLTISEAEQLLIDLYEKDYLVSAQLNLEITKYAPKRAYVVGDVRKPGSKNLGARGELKLTRLLTKAGGVLQGSTVGNIMIERKNGEVEKYSIKGAEKVKVSDGDMVTVRVDVLEKKPEKQVDTLTVSGHVKKPGLIPLPPKGKLDVITAIANAGGFSNLANTKNILVRRKSKNGKFTTIPLNMRNINAGKAPMFYMRKGDIIVVKERIF